MFGLFAGDASLRVLSLKHALESWKGWSFCGISVVSVEDRGKETTALGAELEEKPDAALSQAHPLICPLQEHADFALVESSQVLEIRDAELASLQSQWKKEDDMNSPPKKPLPRKDHFCVCTFVCAHVYVRVVCVCVCVRARVLRVCVCVRTNFCVRNYFGIQMHACVRTHTCVLVDGEWV